MPSPSLAWELRRAAPVSTPVFSPKRFCAALTGFTLVREDIGIVMKPSGASSSLISRGLPFRPIEETITSEPIHPVAQPEAEAQDLAEDPRQELLRQQALKKAAEGELRSKLKTRRLVELCGQVLHRERESDVWFARYEKFFRSPVWKLVSDEAIRKAHFKCEYSKCTKQAVKVQLLEFPEKHLEPNFDWMNRGDILMALCSHHHWMMHGFVMKRVVPFDRQFDPVASRARAML